MTKVTLTPSGGTVKKTVDLLGEEETVNRDISKEDMQDIYMRIDGTNLSLKSVVDAFGVSKMMLEDPESISLKDGHSAQSENQKNGDDENATDSKGQLTLDNVPTPPTVELQEIESSTNRKYYKRLIKGNRNQPSVMREIVYNSESMTKGELSEKMEEKGYNSDSGGFGASLRVLSEVTQEVERETGVVITNRSLGLGKNNSDGGEYRYSTRICFIRSDDHRSSVHP